jgi:tetratricopeptide (TPR) repeat protein
MDMATRAGWTGALLLVASFTAHAETPAACDVQGDFKSPQWRQACDAAIENEHNVKQRALLLQHRAYVAVEEYRYDDAIVDLDAAVKDDPDCADCLHERAYVNVELGEYSRAIADLDREISLRPQFAAAWRERAFARGFSGDLEGEYQDRVRQAELEEQSTSSILARADAAQWTGRFKEAAADLAKAEAQAKKAGDEESLAEVREKRESVALWRLTEKDKKAASRCVSRSLTPADPKLKQLIGDCTQAFLRAKDGPAKAEALTTRASAFLVLDNSYVRATLDHRVAAGLDPANPDMFINLGFAYIGVRHSRAAIQEFDRSLALRPHWMALAGRASAKYNVDDLEGARSDAFASMKQEPNVVAAGVLGAIGYEQGEKEMARDMYLVMYQLGSRGDEVITRLKDLGVSDPENASREAAK